MIGWISPQGLYLWEETMANVFMYCLYRRRVKAEVGQSHLAYSVSPFVRQEYPEQLQGVGAVGSGRLELSLTK